MRLLTVPRLISLTAKQQKDEAEQTPLKLLYQLKFALQCQEG